MTDWTKIMKWTYYSAGLSLLLIILGVGVLGEGSTLYLAAAAAGALFSFIAGLLALASYPGYYYDAKDLKNQGRGDPNWVLYVVGGLIFSPLITNAIYLWRRPSTA